MDQLFIHGGERLHGEVTIQGAKNSVLPILAAALMTKAQVEIKNCPRLRDVDTSAEILRSLGCAVRRQGEDLYIDAAPDGGTVIADGLMRKMRSSAIFLGALLCARGEAELTYPGGCELGPRPIDLHLAGLRAMGAEVEERGGTLRCCARRLHGAHITLSLPSVGATENLMLCACGAEGTTVISNAAREPEIVELQNFLNACGGSVCGAGGSTVVVEGKRPLHGCTYTVMPDRIVTATYLCAAAAAGGEVFLRRGEERHLFAVTALLRAAGCEITQEPEGLRCARSGRVRAVEPVRTAPYPGFPTDAQALVMAALTKSQGTTVFEENLFESRYRHAEELTRMGADIRIFGRTALLRGVETLHGAAVRCTDLRGGAALCVAALAAEGESRITQLCHIRRGYQDIAADLRALGAAVKEERVEE